MEPIIEDYFDQVKIGRKQTFKNMAVFPLLSAYNTSLDYLTLDEALEAGVIEVAEVSEGGSVPDLKVHNRSNRMVLILDGEELVGAKQNRIVNTTILVQANATLVIPVSCVEHGRWSYDSARFSSKQRMMSSRMRAEKSEQVNLRVRATGEFRADREAIWDGIAEKADRMEAASPTGAMAGIYDKEMPRLREYKEHFTLMNYQIGAVFMINGQVTGLDSFGDPHTFSKVFNELD